MLSISHNSCSDSFLDPVAALPSLEEDHFPAADVLDIVVVTHVHLPQIAPLHLADSCGII
jgi:hypothetical protein